MAIPYIGFANNELEKQPRIRIGDGIICPHCEEVHYVHGGINVETKEETDSLLFYRCKKTGKSHLAGISGKLIVGLKTFCSGEIK